MENIALSQNEHIQSWLRRLGMPAGCTTACIVCPPGEPLKVQFEISVELEDFLSLGVAAPVEAPLKQPPPGHTREITAEGKHVVTRDEHGIVVAIEEVSLAPEGVQITQSDPLAEIEALCLEMWPGRPYEITTAIHGEGPTYVCITVPNSEAVDGSALTVLDCEISEALRALRKAKHPDGYGREALNRAMAGKRPMGAAQEAEPTEAP